MRATSANFLGTKAAPSYANNYMSKFEDKHVFSYRLQPIFYKRYIDDIFFVWQHGLDELTQFINHLNQCEPTIKFTEEISEKEVAFLDVRVRIQNNRIVTSVYTKATDSHNYLLFTSAHPEKCKTSIPFSQFLRIRRICSSLTDFDKHVLQYSEHFLKRGYPPKLIEEAAIKARHTPRHELLQYQRTESTSQDVANILVTTFHPHTDELRNIVTQHWDMLGRNNTTRKIHQKGLMVGYRRPQNLRDLLVRARVKRQKTPRTLATNLDFAVESTTKRTKQTDIRRFFDTNRDTPTSSASATDITSPPAAQRSISLTNATLIQRENRIVNHCKNPKCRYCPLLDNSGTITCFVTKTKYWCMKNFTCRSSNLIYLISCRTCGKQYVGQTKRRLMDRFQGHFAKIQRKVELDAVGSHFSQPDHNGTKDLKIQVCDFVFSHPQSARSLEFRLKTEKMWIHRLRCPAPTGLNIYD